MNTPKAVADELLALMRDREEVKKALREVGVSVDDNDGLAVLPEKIRRLKSTRLKIFKYQQFYQWKDEVLPDMEVDEGYTGADLSWGIGKCPNLVRLPDILGIERAVVLDNFINGSPKVKSIRLPDMPALISAVGLARDAQSIEVVEIGSMPINKSLNFAFGACDHLTSVSIGDAPKVEDVFALFYQCGKLKRVKLSLEGGLITTAEHMFNSCYELEVVDGIINLSSATNVNNIVNNCTKLREIRLKGVGVELQAYSATSLSLDSARFLISEAQNVSTPKVISLPQSLVDRYPSEMAELGGVASGKGWTITYR